MMSKLPEYSKQPDELETGDAMRPVQSQVGEALEGKATTHDAVFGEITEDSPNYRNVCIFNM